MTPKLLHAQELHCASALYAQERHRAPHSMLMSCTVQLMSMSCTVPLHGMLRAPCPEPRALPRALCALCPVPASPLDQLQM